MRLIAIAVASLLAAAASAQQQQAPQAPIFNLNDDQVREIMQAARNNLHMAKLPDGGTVARESDAEKAQPLLTFPIGRKVVETGLLSGVANKCAVNWRESKMPQAVSAEKTAVGNNPKAAAYVEFLHGVAMGLAQEQTKDCPPNLKERVTREIAARWK
jgi:hypothetical protein